MPNEYKSELSPSKDIVERLKADELSDDRQLQREARATLRGLLNEAANEIERLREELKQKDRIECIIDSHGIIHQAFTIVYKPREKE